MADLQDVSVYLKNQAVTAVYPNGISQPSVANLDVRIFEGWPNPELLDADLTGMQLFNGQLIPRANGKAAQVSVFPFTGSSKTTQVKDQILDRTIVIVPAVHGMTVSIGSDMATITIGGGPTPGEFVTLIVGNQYVASASGNDLPTILSALASQLSPHVAGITTGPTTITIPNQAYIVARVGATGTLGKVTHKNCQPFMITVWAPDNESRAKLASSIDNLIKKKNKITLPDTSQALVTYEKTRQEDKFQPLTLYRRDLIFDVEYATIEQFTGVEITSVATTMGELANVSLSFATPPNSTGLLPESTGITNAPLPSAPFTDTTSVT